MRYKFLLIFAFLLIPLAFAQSGDGIPANCESAATPEAVANFPRYEFQNSRLVLVNWNTGADALVLENGLVAEAVAFRDWTADCHFLIGTVQINNLSDFAVWDALTGGRVLTISGLRHFPYAYHLYPDKRLIVETPAGAWLLNLNTGNRLLLAASWDELSNRNFRYQPRFDDELGWVFTTLTDGTTAVFEQSTGLAIEDYQSRLNILNGVDTNYDCNSYYSHPVSYENHQIRFNYQGQSRVLRSELVTPDFRSRGFSPDCRYYAAAIQSADELTYDTYVWDTQTGREMVFPDANLIPHPLSFLTNERALIQTRNGGYLWKLDTDERILLTEGVKISSENWGPATIQNFRKIEMLNGVLWAITVSENYGVTLYDVNTGAVLAFYDYGGTSLADYRSLGNNWLLMRNAYDYRHRSNLELALWNIATGQAYYLKPHRRVDYWQLTILSEDSRYFLLAVDCSRRCQSYFMLWDLQNLNADGTASQIVDANFLQTSSYPNRSSFRDGILTVGERSWDVFTGAMLYIEDAIPALAADNTIAAPVSDCTRGNRRVVRWNDNAYVVDATSGARLADLGRASFPLQAFTLGDCYIANSRGNFQLWDASNYAPIASPFDYTSIIDFAPDGRTVLISARNTSSDYGTYLWHIPSNQLVRLVSDGGGTGGRVIYWDYARQQVFLAQGLIVRAFNLQTGQMTTYYEGNSAYNNYEFNHQIYLNRVINGRWLLLSGAIITVIYDLDTGTNTAIRSDEVRELVAMSPSGRYLVIVGTSLRVWDLTNLAADLGARTANFAFEVPTQYSTGTSLHFLDETSVELADYQGNITRWNILTGEELP